MGGQRVEDTFNAAIRNHQAGRLAEAEQLYRQVLAVQPNHAVAIHHLGLIAHQVGRNDQAVELIGRAIELNPNLVEAHNNLGSVYRAIGRLDEAIASCQRAISLRPGYADAYNNLGNALSDKGQMESAIAAYRQAIAYQPNLAEAYSNLGNLFRGQHRFDEAIDELHRAIEIDPNSANAYSNLGNVLRDKGQWDEAIAACRRAIEIAPNHGDALNNLGNALDAKGESDEAIAALRRAIQLSPNMADAHSNLGASLRNKGKLDGAMASCRRAIELQPQLAEAHHNLALALLARGEFDQGWREYEWRWKCEGFPSPRWAISRPDWDGRPLEGRTILLHAEQGFGDAIQFARYVPMVAKRGGKIILECRPELQGLFQNQDWPGVLRVIIPGDAPPTFDCYAPLMSLPRIFGGGLGNIPGSTPYLRADAKNAGHWRERLGEHSAAAKIGLVWAGSPTHMNDRNRSIDPEKLAPIMRMAGVQLFSLQKGTAAHSEMKIIDWTDELHDFADTAALISNLDLIIAADTAVAHLAGALNKPVWVLLPFAADWRWMLERADSPWYPSMRLFRQTRARDWDSVIERVVEALSAWVKNRE